MADKVKTMQPHSGAIMLAVYNFVKDPKKHKFIIRVKEPINTLYDVTILSQTRDTIIVQTGTDYPCYSEVTHSGNFSKFTVYHRRHSSVREEYWLDKNKLYSGDLTTEAGLRISFEAEFKTPEQMVYEENYRLNGLPVYARRDYEVESAY